MRTIVVDYVLSTEQDSVELISQRLGIYPSETRSIFPEGSVAKPYWFTSMSSTKDNIEEPLQEMIDILTPKKEVIHDLVREYKIASSVVVTIRTNYSDRPEIAIPSYQLRFFADIEAELLFDIAYEW